MDLHVPLSDVHERLTVSPLSPSPSLPLGEAPGFPCLQIVAIRRADSREPYYRCLGNRSLQIHVGR